MNTPSTPGRRAGSRAGRGGKPLLLRMVALATLALAVWLFLPSMLSGFQAAGGGTSPKTPSTEAERQLAALEIVADGGSGEAPPYSRSQFGDGWGDLDGDGCSTRNEILSRDLTEVVYRGGTNDCVVESGILDDPYTATTIQFQRGETTSQMVQIDHVVALADAWNSGAWQWETEQRLQFSNDPLNLLAVDGDANQEKGAATFDQWVPTNKKVHCEYAARQVIVKYKWGLAVTRSEHDALAQTLAKCPEQAIPDG